MVFMFSISKIWSLLQSYGPKRWGGGGARLYIYIYMKTMSLNVKGIRDCCKHARF